MLSFSAVFLSLLLAAASAQARTIRDGPSRMATLSRRQALPAGVDLGSCTDPTLEFGENFDGRKETSFRPANLNDFNHGSAQNPTIITTFICDTFVNKCGANQAAQDLCAQAEGAISNVQTGATADTFNAFFGVQTNFAAIQPIDNQGRPVGAAAGNNGQAAANGNGNAQNNNAQAGQAANANAQNAVQNNGQAAAVTVTVTQDCQAPAQTVQAQVGSADEQAAAGNNQAVAAGGNLQTFQGNLGGSAPAVTAGGRGFVVEGSDDFLNVNAALGRSCDIQKNACANAANSKAINASVQECDQQNQQCRAAI